MIRYEQPTKISKDAYIIISIEHTTGFKFSIAPRGYMLKSWNEFHSKIRSVKKTSWKEVSEKVYMKTLRG